MAQKGLCNITTKRILEDRGALPKEDGDLLRGFQAMHEENCLSSRLREDVEGEEEEKERLNEEAKQEAKVRKDRWREKGKGLRSKEGVWIV